MLTCLRTLSLYFAGLLYLITTLFKNHNLWCETNTRENDNYDNNDDDDDDNNNNNKFV